MAGIDYGSDPDSSVGKLLPFNKTSSAWWNPGESEWLFGGGATKGMLSEPQTGNYQRGYLQQDFMNRGPVMANATQSDQTRGQQGQLAQMLMQQAQGTRQGAGELAVQRQIGNANAAQTSQAQMARGANAALAQRTAARTKADIGVNGAGQAGIAQMQDQQAAQNQLGGLLGTQRQQDIGMAQGNQQSAIQQQQLQLAALAQMLGVDKAALEQDLEKRKIEATDKGAIGGIMQGIGAMFASDERVKEHIVDAGSDVDWMLDNLTPERYRYKDQEKHGAGEFTGVLAQDLERSMSGRSLVVEVDGVKHVDQNRAIQALLASVARLNERVRELEGK